MADAVKPSISRETNRCSISDKAAMTLTQVSLNGESQQKDARTKKGEEFYNEVKSGIFRIYKTTRAGATVGLCISSSIRLI